MTLAVGFKFEHPKAQGLSPIFLLSDSRFTSETTFGDKAHYDNGKKLHPLFTNIFALIAGKAFDAEHSLNKVKKCLTLSSHGSFKDLELILKSSFESTITTWDNQTPHCLLGAISAEGDSRLFYAKPLINKQIYNISEELYKCIGYESLEPKLQKKIEETKHSGLYRPSHFMCLPDEVYPRGYDLKRRVIKDSIEISKNIAIDFLEIVKDPTVVEVNPPLQAVLILPSRPISLDLFEIASSTQIERRTARHEEARSASCPNWEAIVELDIQYLL